MLKGKIVAIGRENSLLSCVLAGMVIVLYLGVVGCSDEGQEGSGDAVSKKVPLVHSYPLRGRIESLPYAGDPASELKIRHEAIDDFKMGDGEPSPMRSMAMPFSPGPGESLEGLAVGDAIEFVFEMQWEPSREMRVVSFKKLPAGTVLAFETGGQ